MTQEAQKTNASKQKAVIAVVAVEVAAIVIFMILRKHIRQVES